MLLKETMTILRKLLKQCDLTNVKLEEARIIVHYDPKTPDEWTNEFDILITPNVSHRQIQRIDKILNPYKDVEMQVTDEGLRIFEREP